MIITFSGIDGVGKTTTIKTISHILEKLNVAHITIKEPYNFKYDTTLSNEQNKTAFELDRAMQDSTLFNNKGLVVLADRSPFCTVAYFTALQFFRCGIVYQDEDLNMLLIEAMSQALHRHRNYILMTDDFSHVKLEDASFFGIDKGKYYDFYIFVQNEYKRLNKVNNTAHSAILNFTYYMDSVNSINLILQDILKRANINTKQMILETLALYV